MVSIRILATLLVPVLVQAKITGSLFSWCPSPDGIELIEGHFLKLHCHKGTIRRHKVWSVLDLDECFSNKHGELSTDFTRSYRGSCRDCNLEDKSAWLNCDCLNGGGEYKRTRLDLDNLIGGEKNKICCKSTNACSGDLPN